MAELKLNITAVTAQAQTAIKGLESTINGLVNATKKLSVNKDLTAQMNAYTKAVNASTKAIKAQLEQEKLRTQQEKTRTQAAKTATEQQRAQLQFTKQLTEAAKAQTQTQKAQTEQSKQALNAAKAHTEAVKQGVANYKAITTANNQYNETLRKTWQEDNRHEEQMKKLSIEEQKVTAAKQEHTTATRTQTAATKQSTVATESHRKSILMLAQSFLEYQIAASLIMKPIYKLREAFQSLNDTLKQTEDHMTIIKRVIGQDMDMKKTADELYDIAIKFGAEIEDVWQVAENFAKSGLSWQDTLRATEAGVLALNVAEMTAEQSSTGLIAVMNQFGYTAKDLVDIIDILNKTANSAPVTTEKLLQALQKTGSYAKAANLDLEKTVAIITAISGATGASGQQLGTAVKSLLAYTTKEKSLNIYAGLSDNMAQVVAEYRKGATSILEVWRQLSTEMKNLSAEQAEALNNYMLTEDGLAMNEELANSIGEEMEELQQDITGVYDTAGVYRKNYFIALMKNFDAVEKAITVASDAQGYSMKANADAMETYTKKVQVLEAQWQKMANDEQGFLGFKKSLVEIATGLLKAIDYVGGLRTALLALLTVVGALFGAKIIAALSRTWASIKSGIVAISNITKVTKLEAAAVEANTAAKEANEFATWAAGNADVSAADKANLARLATEAQTKADEAQTVAVKAKTAATNMYVAIAMLAVTVISAVAGAIKKQKQEQEELREKTIEAWKEIEEENKQLSAYLNTLKTAGTKTKEYETAENALATQLGITRGEIEKNSSAYNEYIKQIKAATQAKIKEAAIEAAGAAGAAKERVQNVGQLDVSREFGTTHKGYDYSYLEKYFDIFPEYGTASFGGNNDAFEQYEAVTDLINEMYKHEHTDNSLYARMLWYKSELENLIVSYLTSTAEADIMRTLGNGGEISDASYNIAYAMNKTGATERWRSVIEGVYNQWLTAPAATEENGGSATETAGFSKEQEKNREAFAEYLRLKNAVNNFVGDKGSEAYAQLVEQLAKAEEDVKTIFSGSMLDIYGANQNSVPLLQQFAMISSGATGYGESDTAILLALADEVKAYLLGQRLIEEEEDDSLKKLADYNKETVSLLKEIRNAADAIAELEEKRENLMTAQSQLNTKVYNAATGQWEISASPKAVDSARTSYRDALRKTAENEIYGLLEEGVSLGTLLAVLDKYNDMGLLDEGGWLTQMKNDLSRVFDLRYYEGYKNDVLAGLAAGEAANGAGNVTINNNGTTNDDHSTNVIVNGINLGIKTALSDISLADLLGPYTLVDLLNQTSVLVN